MEILILFFYNFFLLLQIKEKMNGEKPLKKVRIFIKIVDAVSEIKNKYNCPDFIISYKLSPEEPYENGINMDEAMKLIKILVNNKVKKN